MQSRRAGCVPGRGHRRYSTRCDLHRRYRQCYAPRRHLHTPHTPWRRTSRHRAGPAERSMDIPTRVFQASCAAFVVSAVYDTTRVNYLASADRHSRGSMQHHQNGRPVTGSGHRRSHKCRFSRVFTWPMQIHYIVFFFARDDRLQLG